MIRFNIIYLLLDVDSNNSKLEYVNGVCKLTLLLPARQEKCEFTLKLLNETVEDLVNYIKKEDRSIEKAQVYTESKLFI
jgi:hypothetical protein